MTRLVKPVSIPWSGLLLSLFCLALLAGCGGGGGGSDSPVSTGSASSTGSSTPPVIPFGQRVISSIYSPQEDTQYNLQIYLPASYASSQDTYPIVYALDGDIYFTNMAGILDAQGSKVILVGIGRSDRRTLDYNLPGSPAFYNFVTLDLIPFIEKQYRVRTTNRTLVGHSFGGLFVGLALFMDRAGGRFFNNFVALEGTFNIDSFTSDSIATMEQKMFDASGGRLPITLLMSGATCCYYGTTQDLYNKIHDRNYQGLTSRLMEYSGSHGGMFVPSFTDAMHTLFP